MDYSKLKVPNHVAIIVDGNGRWATEKGMSRSEGHQQGFLNLKKLLAYMFSKNIKYISAYLFSTENFKRSKVEVNFLMNLLTGQLTEILEFCHQEKIKAVFSGRKENLSKKVVEAMEKIEQDTSKYQEKIFNICFNYGGHAEIIDATKKIVKDVQAGKLDMNKLDEETFNHYLYQDLPPIDLLIRTSGEKRLSNFMLYQASYAELYFTDTYFPSFDEEAYEQAIDECLKRNRRFGGDQK